MELRPPSRLSDLPEHRRARPRLHEPLAAAERYLEHLPLRLERRRDLARRAAVAGDGDLERTMTELHRLLSGELLAEGDGAYGSIRGRFQIARGAARSMPLPAPDSHGRLRLPTTPVMSRKSMAPREWLGRHGATAAAAWQSAGSVRRSVLLTLTVLQTALAAICMSAVLPYHGAKLSEAAVLVLFAVLFGWVSAGFWTALMGLWVQWKGDERFAISGAIRRGPDASAAFGAGASSARASAFDAEARVAVIMPICNEDVQRVFAGIRATWESLERTGAMGHFDFYVLSDTSEADVRVAETQAWLDTCRDLRAFGNLFYRWRAHRIKRKSGNVGDFCRRWGNNYRYMVVLDADSVMTGDCLVNLLRLMEASPAAGIIQTAPRAAGRETLFARVQQFATRLYGPLFTAGLHYWQLGESHYWGHNAIIRLAPFMRHCALGRLPGGGSLSGEILSHDFVEAALMRRAGWGVWIAYDLPGSYEEMPPNLVDELKRDRRWCEGNLMNARLMFGEGLHPAHRAVFMTGVMAYLSAPLWFLFLLLSTGLLAAHTLIPPTYFVEPNQLFPVWPEWHEQWAVALSVATAALLFLPKILSAVLVALRGAAEFGGPVRLFASLVAEALFSALVAPIRMLFHTQFVLGSLMGWKVSWKSPPRADTETGWNEALRRHGLHSLLGFTWAGAVYWLNPSYLWWLLPVVGAIALSIPLSVFSSRVSLGRRLRHGGFFAIPEETRMPLELRRVEELCAGPASDPGFVDAVVDPVVNALCCATGIARPRQPAEVRAQRATLVQRALTEGPGALTSREKSTLLGDPLALSRLHFEAWTSATAHIEWRAAQVPRERRGRVVELPREAARTRVRTGKRAGTPLSGQPPRQPPQQPQGPTPHR